MITRVLRSSGSTRKLVAYVLSERGEHLNPRIIAAFDDPAKLDPKQVAALLDVTARAANVVPEDRAVYHLILASARADEAKGLAADRHLSDDEWGSIAKEALTRAGLVGNGAGRDVRWIAVRHDEPGREHVHVVATLATEEGRRVVPFRDYLRLGEAAREAEVRYGLRQTAPRDRTSVPALTRAEQERAQRHRREPDRVTLRREVRTAAASSTSLDEFLERLRQTGVVVKLRHSQIDGQVTGLAFGLPGRDGVTFSGGKLAPDLTLPKLRARWETPGHAGVDPVARAIRAVQSGDPDAAWAAGDLARAVAGRRRGDPLDQAATELDRAAREPHGRIPTPSSAGAGLRASAVAFGASHVVQSRGARQVLVLVGQLALLAEAVARLRQAQGRPHQAQAAQRAAQQLHVHHARQAARLAPAAQVAPAAGLRATHSASRGLRR